MYKKIIALVCSIATIISLIPATAIAAGDYDMTKAEATLKALNIMPGDRIINDSLIYALAGFLYEEPENVGTAEEIASINGFINSGETYDGKKVTTFNEAVKYAVITLGYKEQAEICGGYPEGYIKVAHDLKILDGIISNGEGNMSRDNAIKLVYNMIDAEPMLKYYNGPSDKGYHIARGETLLSLNRDIYVVEDIMTATYFTSIYEEIGTSGKEYVKIGEKEYLLEENCPTDHLGENVVAYIRDNENDDDEVIYITSGENKILTIEAEDIEDVAEDFKEIEYDDGSDRTKTAKITQIPRVVYNGVYYGAYTVEDLMPEIGSLKLIDNNEDGKYEVIFVNSYETMIVDVIDKLDNKIYNKYSFVNAIDSIEYDFDESEGDCFIYDAVGNETTISAISIDSVLSVAVNKPGSKKLVKIYISGIQKVSGTIKHVDVGEDELKIGDKAYEMSPDLLKQLSSVGKVLTVGMLGDFYIDVFGRVAFVRFINDSGYKVLLKVYQDEIEEKYYAIYMDLDEEWHETAFTDKVKVNGERMSAAVVFDMLHGTAAQIVKIKTNEKGEIKAIEIATESATHMDGTFTKTPEAQKVYFSGPRSFGMEYFLNSGAKMVVFPEEPTTDRSAYYVRDAGSMFGNETWGHLVTAYDIDSLGFTDILSIKENSNMRVSNMSATLFLVLGVDMVVRNDELYYELRGAGGGTVYRTFLTDNERVIRNLKAGDIVNLAFDPKGMLCEVRYYTNLRDGNYIHGEFQVWNKIDLGTRDLAVLGGHITETDFGRSAVKLIDNNIEFTVKINPTREVLVYYENSNRCEYTQASSLKAGDKVYIRTFDGNVQEIVCIK